MTRAMQTGAFLALLAFLVAVPVLLLALTDGTGGPR